MPIKRRQTSLNRLKEIHYEGKMARDFRTKCVRFREFRCQGSGKVPEELLCVGNFFEKCENVCITV